MITHLLSYLTNIYRVLAVIGYTYSTLTQTNKESYQIIISKQIEYTIISFSRTSTITEEPDAIITLNQIFQRIKDATTDTRIVYSTPHSG